MLRKTFTLLVAAVFMIASAQATIWRVNNTPGVFDNVKIFKSFALVYSHTAKGDTIHFEPSTITYDASITISKKLILIGTGAWVADTFPKWQASVLTTWVGTITINNGADGTIITGLNNSSITINNVKNIVIKRCFSTGLISATQTTNLLINGCLLTNDGTDIQIGDGTTSNGCSGVVISNNISRNIYVTDHNTDLTKVTNNTINISGYGNLEFNNVDFVNNIIAGPDNNGYYKFYNSTINYNVFSGAIPNNNNNSYGTSNLYSQSSNLNSGFVNGNTVDATNPKFNYDAGYKVVSGPAFGYGSDGSDCGAFGGQFPYHLALQSTVPAIYNVSVPAQAGNSLKFSVSTKSNN